MLLEKYAGNKTPFCMNPMVRICYTS